MRLFPFLAWPVAAAALATAWWLLRPDSGSVPAPDAPRAATAVGTVGAVRFVPNVGQWHEDVAYGVLGATAGWLHRDGFTLRFERTERRAAAAPDLPAAGPVATTGCVVRTRFLGAATQAVTASARLPGVHNFLVGDPERWRADVPGFAAVHLAGVHAGLDVVFRPLAAGTRGAFEYDLVLAPGADLAAFAARCEGASSLRIDAAGQLCVQLPTPDGPVELVQQAPIAWQETPTGRRPLTVAFRLLDVDVYGFVAVDLDASLPAVVDPGVVWSSYLGGGASDSINDLVWRPGLGVWVGGWAGSTDFPTTVGAYRTTGQRDGFVARLDDAGTVLQFGTYLGGGLGDEVRGIALGPGLQPTVVGFTRSFDFPVTPGALQPNYAGASLVVDIGDAFVARLSATGGALLAATYLGGMFDDVAEAVAVDAQGYAFVAGWTSSPNFPTTPGAWQPLYSGPVTLQTDGFVSRIAPNAQTAAYSTFVGGSLPDSLLSLALDAATGEVVVGGWSVSANFPVTATAYRTSSAGASDIVCARLNAAGSAPVFSTFLGGIGGDFGNAVSLAADGSVWLGGFTNSSNFPTSTNAPQRMLGGGDDAVVCRLSADGQALPFSTLLGGAGTEQVRGIVENGADLLVVGETSGPLPVTSNAAQPVFGGGTIDGFVAHYTGGGVSLDYCSYFGGTSPDTLDSVALANSGLAVIGGWSFGTDFPVTPGALQTSLRGAEDGVVFQLDLLTDLGDGLQATGLSNGAAVSKVGAGEVDGLVVELTNRTPRELSLEALRLLVAGRGAAPAQVRSLAIYRDDPALPGTRDHLVGGPVAVVADDDETEIPLLGVSIPVGASVILRAVVDLRPDTTNGTVEVACAAVDAAAWTVRAVGAGAGPAVRVLGTGRVAGPSLVAGLLPGDADDDGQHTVVDLRRLCARLGETERMVDTDGDGVLTLADVGRTRDALLGVASLVRSPAFVVRGQWFTVQGVFPLGQTVDASLGGRSLVLGCVTPRELTLRVDANQPVALQELQVLFDGRPVVSATVQVQ